MQQIRGEHIVRSDGTVSVGVYGSVYVAGMTLDQVKAAVETHLAKYLARPEVSVDVGVQQQGLLRHHRRSREWRTGGPTAVDWQRDGPRRNQQFGRPPACRVQETHLGVAARSGRLRAGPDLPVDWVNLTRARQTATNYQVLPGDRVYVMSQPLITTDTYLSRLYAPIERTFGILLLGSSTIQQIKNPNGINGNNGNNGGF